jgi:hypothetical protein
MLPDLTLPHLAACRSVLGSYRSVAEILGVPLARVTRWRKKRRPNADDADRLAALSTAVEMMGRWLVPEAVPDWLRAPNPHAERLTPAYLIREGRIADLMGTIEADKAGSYA